LHDHCIFLIWSEILQLGLVPGAFDRFDLAQPNTPIVRPSLFAFQGFTMIQVANPHGLGSKEWQGAWANTDVRRWKENPEVGRTLMTDSTQSGIRQQ
jgi:hypothetical protein